MTKGQTPMANLWEMDWTCSACTGASAFEAKSPPESFPLPPQNADARRLAKLLNKLEKTIDSYTKPPSERKRWKPDLTPKAEERRQDQDNRPLQLNEREGVVVRSADSSLSTKRMAEGPDRDIDLPLNHFHSCARIQGEDIIRVESMNMIDVHETKGEMNSHTVEEQLHTTGQDDCYREFLEDTGFEAVWMSDLQAENLKRGKRMTKIRSFIQLLRPKAGGKDPEMEENTSVKASVDALHPISTTSRKDSYNEICSARVEEVREDDFGIKIGECGFPQVSEKEMEKEWSTQAPNHYDVGFDLSALSTGIGQESVTSSTKALQLSRKPSHRTDKMKTFATGTIKRMKRSSSSFLNGHAQVSSKDKVPGPSIETDLESKKPLHVVYQDTQRAVARDGDMDLIPWNERHEECQTSEEVNVKRSEGRDVKITSTDGLQGSSTTQDSMIAIPPRKLSKVCSITHKIKDALGVQKCEQRQNSGVVDPTAGSEYRRKDACLESESRDAPEGMEMTLEEAATRSKQFGGSQVGPSTIESIPSEEELSTVHILQDYKEVLRAVDTFIDADQNDDGGDGDIIDELWTEVMKNSTGRGNGYHVKNVGRDSTVDDADRNRVGGQHQPHTIPLFANPAVSERADPSSSENEKASFGDNNARAADPSQYHIVPFGNRCDKRPGVMDKPTSCWSREQQTDGHGVSCISPYETSTPTSKTVFRVVEKTRSENSSKKPTGRLGRILPRRHSRLSEPHTEETTEYNISSTVQDPQNKSIIISTTTSGDKGDTSTTTTCIEFTNLHQEAPLLSNKTRSHPLMRQVSAPPSNLQMTRSVSRDANGHRQEERKFHIQLQ